MGKKRDQLQESVYFGRNSRVPCQAGRREDMVA